jgi:hypothetical protein
MQGTVFLGVRAPFFVASFPDLLFSGGSRTIVEGSAVWLYCLVTSRRPLVMTWEKDGIPLVQDVPHIRMRRSQDGEVVTYLLVVEPFQSSDSGAYQCTAWLDKEERSGNSLTLAG